MQMLLYCLLYLLLVACEKNKNISNDIGQSLDIIVHYEDPACVHYVDPIDPWEIVYYHLIDYTTH